MRPVFVSLALDRERVEVTPTCSKEQGPFECVECSEKLILKQGPQIAYHFAHASVDNEGGCSGGGDALEIRAAKLDIVEYISNIQFVAPCPKGLHKHERQYWGCRASQDRSSADVSVFLGIELKAMVRVTAGDTDSSDSAGEPLESRVMRVGAANVWQVRAKDVPPLQRNMHRASETVNLASSNARECAECAHALEVMECERQQQALEAAAMDRVRCEEALEIQRKANALALQMREEREARRRAAKARYDAAKKHRMEEETAPPETPSATVEIIDDETLRRNGVLKKKKYLPTGGPGSKIGRGKYKWVRVESVDEVVN